LKREEIGYKLEKSSDLNPLFEQITNNVKYVLLGEASHRTSEFYNWHLQFIYLLKSINMLKGIYKKK